MRDVTPNSLSSGHQSLALAVKTVVAEYAELPAHVCAHVREMAGGECTAACRRWTWKTKKASELRGREQAAAAERRPDDDAAADRASWARAWCLLAGWHRTHCYVKQMAKR